LLLCHINDVVPGTVLGAAVVNPEAPWVQLLKPGVVLDQALLKSLRERGVEQLWIHHDIAADLDAAVAAQAAAVKVEMYQRLKNDFSKISERAIGAVDVQKYRQVMCELVLQLAASGEFASLSDQLFSCKSSMFSHSSNVAYISVLVGLELQDYIVRERKRLSAQHARDLTSLGLGAMMHDIGKIECGDECAAYHETTGEQRPSANDPASPASNPSNGAPEPETYRRHSIAGYRMLRDVRMPASATQIVLNHHQRFDGKGWPKVSAYAMRDHDNAQSGHQIHVFTRIVAAANVLDNLLTGAEQSRRPPVAALSEFTSTKFDGWFDPVIRRAVVRRIPPFAVGSLVTLSDGRQGVVTMPNLKNPCRPAVRPLDGSPLAPRPSHLSPSKDQYLPADVRIVECAGVNVERWNYALPERAKLAA
jgi:HD-GYP domain-containing protein (c-di-GMP phosphodiesterase class II)